MTESGHGSSAAGVAAASIGNLCRREAWRFASWWSDFVLMGVGAAAAWLLAVRLAASASPIPWCGAITASAMGLCAGAVLPLLVRMVGAWRLGPRLEQGRGGASKASLRAQFLAASLHQAGTSAMRCSAEDLRRMVAVAASGAVHAARTAATPATVAAFVAPAIALIGGLDMAGRAAGASPIAALAPSMMCGVAGGLGIVLLVEAFAALVRGSVERWGAGVDMSEVGHLAGRTVSRRPGEVGTSPVEDANAGASSSNSVDGEDYEQTLRKLTQQPD